VSDQSVRRARRPADRGSSSPRTAERQGPGRPNPTETFLTIVARFGIDVEATDRGRLWCGTEGRCWINAWAHAQRSLGCQYAEGVWVRGENWFAHAFTIDRAGMFVVDPTPGYGPGGVYRAVPLAHDLVARLHELWSRTGTTPMSVISALCASGTNDALARLDDAIERGAQALDCEHHPTCVPAPVVPHPASGVRPALGALPTRWRR